MKTTLATALLAACTGVAALAFSATADAARVGYVNNGCYGSQGGAPEIAAAGHTPVALPSYASITAEQLNGLAAVFVGSCWSGTNPAVDGAVAAGMALLVHDNDYPEEAGARLPGNYLFGVANGSSEADINFTSAARFLGGPAGTLNNASLDGGNSSNHGIVSTATLAAGIRVLATGTAASEATIIEYAHGSGRVVYSTIPLSCYLNGGGCAQPGGGLEAVSAGMQRYATNLVAHYAGPLFTTCAAEGYTGAKLTMCRSVCESGATGTTLAGRIRLYTAIYRETPPCGL